MVKNYSLSDYRFSIVTSTPGASAETVLITLGGKGNFLGNIKATFEANVWEKETDVLGNSIFSKSYNRSGTIELTLKMLANECKFFDSMMIAYFSSDGPHEDKFFGIVIESAFDPTKHLKLVGSYCVLQKLPDLEYGAGTNERTYTFLVHELSPVTSE